MQGDDLIQSAPDVDYTKILPIQQKRTIAFVNHFIMNTVSYLNNFAQSCESRFMEFEYKMQKIEASLHILEAQLSSIPEFKPSGVIGSRNEEHNSDDNKTTSNNVTSDTIQEEKTAHNDLNEKSADPDIIHEKGVKACEHPNYTKFFKMLRVGVQEQAVKLKMSSEGYDPSILDNPDSVILI